MQETDNPSAKPSARPSISVTDRGHRRQGRHLGHRRRLLAGAVQYWLYSRQPCADPQCEECVPISTAEGRIEELRSLMRQFAEESEYFHSPTDRNVGRA
jgi:hypothetical protein